MRVPPAHSPCSFNNLNSFNSTQDSLLNAQTLLRDPHFETSKGGKEGVNWEGKKGEKLRQAREIALQVVANSGAQPGKERSQVVAGNPFSWEEKEIW